jgi:hypothetical protein
MPKKIPLQGGEPVRGGDTPSIAQGGYSGNIPATAITALSREAAKLEHGTATLTLHIRDGQLARFITARERSHMAEACNGQ